MENAAKKGERAMKKKIKQKSAGLIDNLAKTYKKAFSKEKAPGIRKKYLKSVPMCKVTFTLPKEAAPDARNVAVVGDFNGWDPVGTMMKKLKDGTFTATVDLEKDREYQFRYLVDSKKWENDWNADKYVPTPYGDGDNSVVIV
jgi:1,4-alpha-glucan branching enzyme